jgi:hypothetical protein
MFNVQEVAEFREIVEGLEAASNNSAKSRMIWVKKVDKT